MDILDPRETPMDLKKDDLISLREAAKLSGYTPDYIGQLIRSGKLPGKQVFSNVAWMTTEEAVLEYLATKKSGSPAGAFARSLLTPELATRLYAVFGWIIIALLASFALFLAYVTAVSIDHRIEQQSLRTLPYVE